MGEIVYLATIHDATGKRVGLVCDTDPDSAVSVAVRDAKLMTGAHTVKAWRCEEMPWDQVTSGH